jgi:amidase
MNNLTFLTAVEMARGLREKQFSAVELLEAHLARIANENPRLNAVVTQDAEGARARAQEADAAQARGEIWGPLHGVPAALKDVWATAGMRTTASYPGLADYIPQIDATVVARLKSAGAIIFGKTNMPALAMDTQTNSPIFGRANNPWDIERTPGGSTGGGGAALAAGLSAFDIGSDLAGSIRIPSNFCGVFGIKTTLNRVPATGHIPPIPGKEANSGMLGALAAFGPLARSVEDLELLLGLIAGPDGLQTDLPPVPFQPVPAKEWQQYRLAFCETLDVPVDPEVRRTVRMLAEKLEAAGCVVEEALPENVTLQETLQIYGWLLGAAMAAVDMAIPLPGPLLRLLGKMEKGSMAHGYLNGMAATLKEYAWATGRQGALVGQVESFLSRYDGWILPVSSTPAFRHIEMKDPNASRLVTMDVDGKPVKYFDATSGYAITFNLCGQPSVVIPAGKSGTGLPIGVQIVGRRWSDADLLALAGKISREITGPFCPPPGM